MDWHWYSFFIGVYCASITGALYKFMSNYFGWDIKPFYTIHEAGKITFDDVIGCEEVKASVLEHLDLLFATKSKSTSLKPSNGFIFLGDHGLGKTYLAAAVAGEMKKRYHVNNAKFIELKVGWIDKEIISRAVDYLTKTPCVLFIDESDEIISTSLTYLLTKLDGIATKTIQNKFIVICCSNSKSVPQGLVRSERLDHVFHFRLPNVNERELLLAKEKVNLSKRDEIANEMEGLSPADIINVCRNAELLAHRRSNTVVDMEDYSQAIHQHRLTRSSSSSVRLHDEDTQRILYHECGHALVSYLAKTLLCPIKIYCTGDDNLAGYNVFHHDKTLYTREHLIDLMAMYLGGTLAEEVYLGVRSTAGIKDLEQIKSIASVMHNCGLLHSNQIIVHGVGREEREYEAKVLNEELYRLGNILKKQFRDMEKEVKEMTIQLNRYKSLSNKQIQVILRHIPNQSINYSASAIIPTTTTTLG